MEHLLKIETEGEERVYEYDNFPPILFQAGDILGVFIPGGQNSKLRLRAERGDSHADYYIPKTGSDTVSPYDSIDLRQVTHKSYHRCTTLW